METEFSYAGFWRRAVAYLVDIFIYGILMGLLIGILSAPGYVDPSLQPAIHTITVLIYVFGYAIYFALFESGNRQATPGKMLLSLKVVDCEGHPVSFWRAFGRNLGKYVSGIILMIGYMMAGWTHQKQALHDMMTSCLVIREID